MAHASIAVLSLWFTVTCCPIIEFHENNSLYATTLFFLTRLRVRDYSTVCILNACKLY